MPGRLSTLWSWLRGLGRPSLQQLLLVLVVLMQGLVWLGQGGWFDVWRLERRLADEEVKLAQQRQLIDELEAEIRDLQTGQSAAEERARYELGLMRPGERFVQIVRPPQAEGSALDARAANRPNGSTSAPAGSESQPTPRPTR